jgi:hypothetical protein
MGFNLRPVARAGRLGRDANGWNWIFSGVNQPNNSHLPTNFIRGGYQLYQPQYPWAWPHYVCIGANPSGDAGPITHGAHASQAISNVELLTIGPYSRRAATRIRFFALIDCLKVETEGSWLADPDYPDRAAAGKGCGPTAH